MKLFHSSLECVQHAGKPLIGSGDGESVLSFAKRIKCTGVQLSHFHVFNSDSTGLLPPAVIQQALAAKNLRLSGISCHCLMWVHGAAHTGTRSLNKFIPKWLRGKEPQAIREWAEQMILSLMDVSVALKNYVLPTFWGPYWGLEVASGYPWGMWKGLPDAEDVEHDLIAEGDERFLRETEVIRKRANELGIVFGHEIHRGTGAMCGRDFLRLRQLAGDDPCMGVNADWSHCWDGEDGETRGRHVGHLIVAVHMKDCRVIRGESLSSMEPDWRKRGMYFERLGHGDIDQTRYVQQMIAAGYVERYREAQHLDATATVPLTVEAEGAFSTGDDASADGVKFVNDNFCGDFPEGSFEDGMRSKK